MTAPAAAQDISSLPQPVQNEIANLKQGASEALALAKAGDHRGAAAAFQKLLKQCESDFGSSFPECNVAVVSNLAQQMFEAGDLTGARENFDQAYRNSLVAPNADQTTVESLRRSFQNVSKFEVAAAGQDKAKLPPVRIQRVALDLSADIPDRDVPKITIASNQITIAIGVWNEGHFHDGEVLYREAEGTIARLLPENDPLRLATEGNFAALLSDERKDVEADNLLTETYHKVVEHYGEWSEGALRIKEIIAKHRGAEGDLAGEEADLAAVYAGFQSLKGSDDPHTMRLAVDLAYAFIDDNKFDLAKPQLEKVRQSITDKTEPEFRARVLLGLGAIDAQQGRAKSAEQSYTSAIQLLTEPLESNGALGDYQLSGLKVILAHIRTHQLRQFSESYEIFPSTSALLWQRIADRHAFTSQDQARGYITRQRWIFEWQMDAAWDYAHVP
jgi:tetratricopeptide (TPR) repeat protein